MAPSEAGHAFALVDNDDHTIRRRGDDLLAQHRSAFPFDCPHLGVNLVGSVDRKVEAGERGEGPHGNARRRGSAFTRPGGDDAGHLQAGRDPFPESGNGEVRRRVGPEADHHAVLDFANSGASRRQFAFRGMVSILQSLLRAAARLSASERRRAYLASSDDTDNGGLSFPAARRRFWGNSLGHPHIRYISWNDINSFPFSPYCLSEGEQLHRLGWLGPGEREWPEIHLA